MTVEEVNALITQRILAYHQKLETDGRLVGTQKLSIGYLKRPARPLDTRDGGDDPLTFVSLEPITERDIQITDDLVKAGVLKED